MAASISSGSSTLATACRMAFLSKGGIVELKVISDRPPYGLVFTTIAGLALICAAWSSGKLMAKS